MSYMFPQMAGLPKGENGEEIFGGTIGSNKIFHLLRNTAVRTNSPRWDLYLIYVYALLRNAYSKGIS
ncbi:MAG TPA: hypothetical protein VMB73_13005 [Acetobacteraceae bacterium]|jgi:hypothetical protein|nr:hypothetical protein [Acetobacteraceae bacterium]